MGKSWAAERIALLRKLLQQRNSFGQIAEEMQTTRSAIAGKAHREGLSALSDASPPVTRSVKKRVKIRPLNPHGRSIEVIEPVEALDIAPDVSEFACTITELTHDTCRWPLDAQASADMRYCGDVKLNGAVYCGRHARIAWKSGGWHSR